MLLTAAGAAAAGPRVAVLIGTSDQGAQGLLVAGAGSTVGRDRALASLLRGRVVNAALDETPGAPLIRLGGSGEIRIYVELPPERRRPNDRRYRIAIVGGGYRGVLTSTSTRLPGLVSIGDVARTARALERGEEPVIGWRASDDPRRELRDLDTRLHDVRRARGIANAALIAAVVALVLLRRGRAALLAPLGAIAAALALSALGVTSFWLTGAVVLAAALAAGALPLLPATAAFLALYLAVLVWSPETSALAAIGAQPDGGGRFYGITNQVSTLLLAPTVAPASLLSLPLLVPFALLALVTAGWSRAGADGGGLLVLAAAFALLALHARGRVTARALAVAAVAAVALGAALVGLDAALGGSSHVTRAVTHGTVFDDLWRRLQLSWALATGSAEGLLVTGTGIAVVAALWLRRPRFAAGDAYALAMLVSLVANDAPRKVALYGALGALALWMWNAPFGRSVDSRVVRRLIPFAALAVLLLAGCGGGKEARPLPSTVEGTVTQKQVTGDPARGETVFASQGCGSCHTYAPAKASGKVGPDLDKLAEDAGKTDEPLPDYVKTSIVNPDAYVVPGFQKGVMPSYAQLPAEDVAGLVAFLTQSP